MTTYVVTKNIIRRIFEDIATAHKQIKSFGYGDELDYIQKLMNEDTQELAANVLYPRLFVSPTDSVISPGSYARSYVIMVADRIRTGDNNFTEVESDTDLILLDVIAQIQDSDYGFVLDIDNIAVTPFKNKFADMVTGHMATISLVSDWEFDRCQIPQNFIAVTNPYVPFENGSNEQDPLSWHLAGNNLDYEGFLGTTSAQGYSLGTNSIRRWNLELEGHIVPNASGVYDIGSASNPVRTLYVDNIQGDFDNGITSLNGLTDSVQTFAVGTSGTDFNISSSGGVHTFNIPSASATNRGLITNGTQTIGGSKTFAANTIIIGSSASAGNALVVNNGAGTPEARLTVRNKTEILFGSYLTFTGTGTRANIATAGGGNTNQFRFNTLSPITVTSATVQLFEINPSFSPTSGTAEFAVERFLPSINQTGGANGITRGQYFAPVLTSAADWRGSEWVTGLINTVIIARNTGSAAVQIDSTVQGLLVPRMTTAQKNAISAPTNGLIVYDTTLAKLCVYTTAWETITSV